MIVKEGELALMSTNFSAVFSSKSSIKVQRTIEKNSSFYQINKSYKLANHQL